MKKITLLCLILASWTTSVSHAQERLGFGRQIYQYPAKEELGKLKKEVHLFILSGQSNMSALRPEISFVPEVVKAFGENSVLVVKDSMGSQSIQRWYKDWVSTNGVASKFKGDLYEQLITNVKENIKGRELLSVNFIWMQGERDAASNQVTVYEKSLDGLIGQIKNDLGKDDIHFVIGRLSDAGLKGKNQTAWLAMRELQEEYANKDSSRSWVDCDDLNNKVDRKTGEKTDNVHYTPEGYKILGERFAKEAIQLIKKK